MGVRKLIYDNGGLQFEPDILIIDIETSRKDKTIKKVSAENSKLEYFGAYSYADGKFYHTDDLAEIQRLVDEHRFIVGFNSDEFDLPVLSDAGISFNYKISIDLFKILKKRSEAMMGYSGEKSFSSFKLKTVCSEIAETDKKSGITVTKGDFDYLLLEKEDWKNDNNIWVALLDYLERDVMLTRQLYEYLERYFEGFKDFVRPKDVEMKKYLTASAGSYAYKVICNLAGLEEEYEDVSDEDNHAPDFEGGYVVLPSQEEAHGDCYALDIASSYPHAMMQFNLFAPIIDGYCGLCGGPCERPVKANKMFPDLQGIYCGAHMHPVTKALKDVFTERIRLKNLGDDKNKALKICINTMYGITSKPVFKHVYNPTCSADCTYIGRQYLKYILKTFTDNGYKLLYGDTDSAYIQDPFKNKDKILKLTEKIMSEIKNYVYFPQETFILECENDINHICFFPDSKDKTLTRYLKKMYIYVCKPDKKHPEGKFVPKGLPVIKRTATHLSKKIFEEYIIPEMRKGIMRFPKETIQGWIDYERENNPKLLASTFDVKDVGYYDNPNCMHAQISLKYGPGKHTLVRNKFIGVGAKTKVCSFEEAKKLPPSAFDLDIMWNELGVFIKKDKQMTLGAF